MIFMSDEVDNLSRFRLIIPGTPRLNPQGSLGNYSHSYMEMTNRYAHLTTTHPKIIF